MQLNKNFYFFISQKLNKQYNETQWMGASKKSWRMRNNTEETKGNEHVIND